MAGGLNTEGSGRGFRVKEVPQVPPSIKERRRVGVPSPSKAAALMCPGWRPSSWRLKKGTATSDPIESRWLKLTPSSTERALNMLLKAPSRERKASGVKQTL
jgi:hypothetical protein